MTNVLRPFQILVITLAGWLNCHQQTVIDYLIEENRVLKDHLDGKRIRMVVKAKALARRALDEIETLVTPDRLLAWHRKLIAKKWTYPRKGPGRPGVAQEINELVFLMASDNISWGYDRIQCALANLGHIIAPNTVKNVLKRHGIEPAPEREAYVVGDFLESALERDGCYGFLYGRGLDAPRPSDLLRIVCYAPRNAFRARRRSNHGTQRRIHATDGSQSYRRGRWFF